jgi:hypothetical protein
MSSSVMTRKMSRWSRGSLRTTRLQDRTLGSGVRADTESSVVPAARIEASPARTARIHSSER